MLLSSLHLVIIGKYTCHTIAVAEPVGVCVRVGVGLGEKVAVVVLVAVGVGVGLDRMYQTSSTGRLSAWLYSPEAKGKLAEVYKPLPTSTRP